MGLQRHESGMPDDPHSQSSVTISAAARRALAEAAARRRSQASADAPVERGGRTGPEPTRYGDWENKGIASDF